MKEFITSLIKPLADMLFRLANIVPREAAGVIYILVLLAVMGWVLTLKEEKPEVGSKPRTKALMLSDLRVWAILILMVQTIIYVVLM